MQNIQNYKNCNYVLIYIYIYASFLLIINIFYISLLFTYDSNCAQPRKSRKDVMQNELLKIFSKERERDTERESACGTQTRAPHKSANERRKNHERYERRERCQQVEAWDYIHKSKNSKITTTITNTITKI